MIGKIYYLSKLDEEPEYTAGTFAEWLGWIQEQEQYQLDIETNVFDKWNEAVLISLQFGSVAGDRVQWFIQFSELDEVQVELLISELNIARKRKFIHQARFEYVVLRFYGIELSNIYDTMLAEKVLNGGMEQVDYALADISWKYLRIIMDKSLQMEFGDNVITNAKIRYGITDVAYLDVISRQQIEQAEKLGLMNVISLEMDAIPAFSDITHNGILMNSAKWRENIAFAQPIIQEAYDKINSWIFREPFREYAEYMGYISQHDRFVVNWNSHQQRTAILQEAIPGLAGGTIAMVKAYVRDNHQDMSLEQIEITTAYLDKDYKPLQVWAERERWEFLVKNSWLIPAGESTINWGSNDQVLPMMQLVEKRLQGLSEDDIARVHHPALKDLKKYRDAVKLTTSFGEDFLRKHLCSDSRIRPNINPVMSTGRISMSKPNLQQIIVTEQVGNRYRNAFIADPGFRIVSADYVSQELVTIAHISKDPVWLEAIRNGWDLHSICAEMMFGQKWVDATEPGCAYYLTAYTQEEDVPDKKRVWIHSEEWNDMVSHGWKPETRYKRVQNKQKCSCKGHKPLRYDTKSIDFGLAYGMSEFKLAGDLDITVPEARKLMDRFFSEFPAISTALDFMGEFGVRRGYIQTLAPFFRKRWFPYWSMNRQFIEQHVQKIKYNPALGEIERASKNHPIQGTCADMVKVAMILVKDTIREEGLERDVTINLQVHDEVVTNARIGIEDAWAKKLDSCLYQAGLFIIPSGILKAETTITDMWTK